MARPDTVILLVPGGMGSRLELGSLEVWNSSISALWMVTNPSLLLNWLPLTATSLVPVYDQFVSFLASQGYTPENNLFLFPYDWRQGLRSCAMALAEFVKSQVEPNLAGRKILFVTHSYGCMVTRWGILLPSSASLIDNSLIRGIVAAGPPMLGIPSAFKNLVAAPDLGTLFYTVFQMAKYLFPALTEEIQVSVNRTLVAVSSQLECLPTYPILYGGAYAGAQPYSAFKWGGLPVEMLSLLNTVQQDLLTIVNAPWSTIDMTVLLSDATHTDTGYVLNANDQLAWSLQPGPGDGIVPYASAQAFCSASANMVNLSYPHMQLLDDPVGQAFLVQQHII
jgi:lecithin:cholesterol acyltransferase